HRPATGNRRRAAGSARPLSPGRLPEPWALRQLWRRSLESLHGEAVTAELNRPAKGDPSPRPSPQRAREGEMRYEIYSLAPRERGEGQFRLGVSCLARAYWMALTGMM